MNRRFPWSVAHRTNDDTLSFFSGEMESSREAGIYSASFMNPETNFSDG
jgi:hypothetical protein